VSSSVTRAARILVLLAHSDEPMSLTKVAVSLGIPKSTAYTILRDLTAESFVTLTAPSSYTIGLKAFEVGSAHLRASGVAGVIAPELVRLTRDLNVTSHFAILDGADAVYLCKEDPPGLGVQLASSVGARLPSHVTAVGKICLAWLPQDELPRHVDLKVRGVDGDRLTLKELRGELALVREQGFATDDAQASVGIQCVAAPVFDLVGYKGAIGVSFLRGSVDSLDAVATQVRAAGERTSTLLGGRHPR